MIFSKHCPYRETSAQCLCEGHNVRLYAGMLIGKEFPCPAYACLYLIKDKQDAIRVANFTETFQIIPVRDIPPALALYRLNHDSGCLLCYRLLQCRNVIERDILKSGYKGGKSLVKPVLSCCRKCGHSTAME